jgi:phenylacetate-CoA ligase
VLLTASIENKLASLLAYVAANVPFYQEHFHRRIPHSLSEFPIVRKADLISSFDSFISAKADLNECVVEHTTGSTGRPLRCLKSKADLFLSQRKLWHCRSEWIPNALRRRLLAFANTFALPAENMPANIPGDTDRRASAAYYGDLNMHYFTPREIAELPADSLLERVLTLRPDWVRGTPSLLHAFCVRLTKSQADRLREMRTIQMAETTGENLGEHQREVIEQILGTRVVNLYATREVWPIAYECRQGGLHVLENHVYCELLGTDKYAADTGELCLTALNQRNFPFIRYLIGDVVRLKRDSCPCGKAGLVICRIEGRVGEMLRLSGRVYSSQIFSEVIKQVVKAGILDAGRFVVHQEQEFVFNFTIERRGACLPQCEEYIRQYLRSHLSSHAQVRVTLIEELHWPYTDKNKFFFPLNEQV